MTPARTAKDSPFARNLIGGGGITPCRLAPMYVADRRSLVAGIAIYTAVALVVGIAVVIALAARTPIN